MSQLHRQVQDSIISRFHNFRKTVAKNLSLIVISLIDCGSFSTHQIAASIAKITGKTFHNGENRLANFLKTKTFEVGDKSFRNLVNLVFDLFKKRGFLDGLEYLPINVDFTSERDNFFILSASIPFFGRSIPIFFSMRNYHKKKNQFSQKKMEESFLARLKHILPKMNYILVFDRGFANLRIINTLERLGFNYVIRFKENTKASFGDQEFRLADLSPGRSQINLKDGKTRSLTVSKSQDQVWYLISNLESQDLQTIYKNRFQIEKTFQDQKSSGFNIEKTKIKNYSKFKKLLYCAYLAQTLLLILGEYINDGVDHLKKKSPEALKSI